MQEEIENLDFVQRVNFDYIDSFENNGINDFFIFDDSSEEICNWKRWLILLPQKNFVEWMCFHIKHCLFHQNILGQVVELQNNHIVLFKSPRGVMQLSTLSSQLGLQENLLQIYRKHAV